LSDLTAAGSKPGPSSATVAVTHSSSMSSVATAQSTSACLTDVEQALLEEPVDRDGADQRERVRLLRPAHVHLQGVALVELTAHVVDRGGQVAVAQRRRPGARHDGPHLLLGVGDVVGRPADRLRVADAQLGAGQRQRLRRRVVQLGGELAAGAFLGGHQPGQQLEHAGAGVGGRPAMALGHLVGHPCPDGRARRSSRRGRSARRTTT
jgi:hypothetical protein